jgi:hypothetical protein
MNNRLVAGRRMAKQPVSFEHTSPVPLRGNAPLPSERRIYWQAVGHEHTTNAARRTEAQLAWACVDLSENLKMKRIDVKSQGRSRLRVQRRCMHARCGGVIPMASRRILHEDLSNATDDAKLFG